MAKKSKKPYKFVYNHDRTKVFYINENGTSHELTHDDLMDLWVKFMEVRYEWTEQEEFMFKSKYDKNVFFFAKRFMII